MTHLARAGRLPRPPRARARHVAPHRHQQRRPRSRYAHLDFTDDHLAIWEREMTS